MAGLLSVGIPREFVEAKEINEIHVIDAYGFKVFPSETTDAGP